jgi:YcxB-like protein
VGGTVSRSLAVLLGLIFTFVGLSTLSSQSIGGMLCIAIGIFLILRGLGVLSSAFRRAVESDDSAVHVAVSKSEIVVSRTAKDSSRSNTNNYPWEAIEDILAGPTGVLLAFYGKGEVWIPNTAFSSQEDKSQFLESLNMLSQETLRARSSTMQALVSIARFFGR